MHDNRLRLIIALLLLIVFVLFMALMAVTGAPPAAQPGTAADSIRTEAIATFARQLTATAAQLPTATMTLDAGPTAVTATSLSGTPNCLGLRFVRDVTIPDNTATTPAEVFTKSWLVRNTGTCPWKPGFQVILVGGLAMGGSPFRVTQTVGPGGEIQVSIKMAAPTNQSGVVQGTWMMADEEGITFGDFLTVVIVVSGPTSLVTPLATVTATP